ncbi:galactose ABC transporter substrate-binding protein [Clostridium saccharobutylicum]|uniref:D-galactose/methyl-galactoside binding periplasmic protein MglB n=1 Tax=Clostridium saccharobutylicum TaxID=169679 RepID=A0A1S8ND64_CLOSA|nr:galactose ABC transporter substrate-binding protein [Clostridium saccharobutylicum]OOM14201.1 D-galactose-binding periplasmic protein precursor [Clostridium saccharobutylicum]
MKVLRQTIKSILVMLIIFVLIITTEIQTFSSPISRKTINVGIILFSLDNSAATQLKKEFDNLQNEYSVKVSVFNPQNNLSVQDEMLDSLLKNKIDLIIAMPADTKENAVRNFIERVKPYNTPLVMFNIPPDVVTKVLKDYNRVAFAIPASDKTGEMQGEIVRDLWNNKSIIDENGDNILQYVLVRGPKEDVIADKRTQGVTSTLKSSGIKTELLQSFATNWTEAVAKSYIENIFLTYGDKIEAIIANDDDLALGAVKGLQEYGYNTGNKSKYIPVFGLSGTPEAINLIDKELMSGTIIVDLKKVAEDLYAIGNNLINNANPTENTNLKSEDGVIIIGTNPRKYIKG